MSSDIRLAVVGATGGLGQRIVKQAIELTTQKIFVTAIVRDSAKASSLFPDTVKLKVIPSVDEANKELLVDAFRGQDIILEVIDNSDRVEKVRLITQAVLHANVNTFIVCGGAGALKMSGEENSQRLYEVLGDSIGTWLKPVTLMHLEAQKVAFDSSIGIVAQLCPPGMSAGELTKGFTPSKDLVGGVNSVSYEDVADVLLQAIPELQLFNRSMIGIGRK